MNIWALDTDTKGSLSCIYNRDGLLHVRIYRFPNFQEAHGISKKTGKVKKRTRLLQEDIIQMFKLVVLLVGKPDVVVFEAQRGRPNQSSVATFTFGECNGFLRGALKAVVGFDNVKYVETPAATWKPGMSLDDNKAKAHKMTKKLCPELDLLIPKGKKGGSDAKYDSMCEAFLLAVYTRLHLLNSVESLKDYAAAVVSVNLADRPTGDSDTDNEDENE
jgi:hypothetical protein